MPEYPLYEHEVESLREFFKKFARANYERVQRTTVPVSTGEEYIHGILGAIENLMHSALVTGIVLPLDFSWFHKTYGLERHKKR